MSLLVDTIIIYKKKKKTTENVCFLGVENEHICKIQICDWVRPHTEIKVTEAVFKNSALSSCNSRVQLYS